VRVITRCNPPKRIPPRSFGGFPESYGVVGGVGSSGGGGVSGRSWVGGVAGGDGVAGSGDALVFICFMRRLSPAMEPKTGYADSEHPGPGMSMRKSMLICEVHRANTPELKSLIERGSRPAELCASLSCNTSAALSSEKVHLQAIRQSVGCFV
jgi:hypothetical protein